MLDLVQDSSHLLPLLLIVADHAVQVVDAFHEQILHLERETLSRPSIAAVKLRTSLTSSPGTSY